MRGLQLHTAQNDAQLHAAPVCMCVCLCACACTVWRQKQWQQSKAKEEAKNLHKINKFISLHFLAEHLRLVTANSGTFHIVSDNKSERLFW